MPHPDAADRGAKTLPWVDEFCTYAQLALPAKVLKYPRYGDNLKRPPSVGSHSWLMGALCFALPLEVQGHTVDAQHCIILAIVHGLQNISLPSDRFGSLRSYPRVEELWKELETRTSFESRLVLEIDKIVILLLTIHDRFQTFDEVLAEDCNTDRNIVEEVEYLSEWADSILNAPRPASRPTKGLAPAVEANEWSVEDALAGRPFLLQMSREQDDFRSFAFAAAHLTYVLRQGWLNKGIKDPESVAEHSWMMAALCLQLPLVNDFARQDIAFKDAVSMAIVHDLAETLVGDITPHDGVSKTDKFNRENQTMEYLDQLLSPDSVLKMTWDAFERKETLTSTAVQDLDKFDLGLQAVEYTKTSNAELGSFFLSARKVTLLTDCVEKVVSQCDGGKQISRETEVELSQYYGD